MSNNIRDTLTRVFSSDADVQILAGSLDGAPHERARELAATKFNPLRIEDLVKHAALLLERCIRAREVFLDLQVRASEFALEQERLAVVHPSEAREIELQSRLEALVARTESETLTESGNAMAGATNRLAEGIAARDPSTAAGRGWVHAAGELAFNSAYLHHNEARTAAEALEGIRLIADGRNLEVSKIQTSISSSVALRRGQLERERSQVIEQIGSERIARNRAAASTAAALQRLAREPEHALNYAGRAALLVREFRQDFADLYEHLIALESGIRLVFGLNKRLPEQRDDVSFLTELAVWLRTLASDLLVLELFEEEHTATISARAFLNGDWAASVAAGSFVLNIPASAFPSQTLLRIKSMELFAITADQTAFWSAGITPAPSDAAPQLACFLGSVGRRADIRTRPQSGDALSNMSPVGVWRIEIPGTSPGGGRISDLDDLHLDIRLAALASNLRSRLPW
jgi:hypothetical protein